MRIVAFWAVAVVLMLAPQLVAQTGKFVLNEAEYFELGGVNVMVFQDIYPEGHQSGLSVIQHAVRVASNGDVRLEPTPGQWSPVPRMLSRDVDAQSQRITSCLAYPDPDRDRKGFNPIIYPDFDFRYCIEVAAEGDAVRVRVHLDEPMPPEWATQVGFLLELFPGAMFGKSWYLGPDSGVFPLQPNGPTERDSIGPAAPIPLGVGRRLSIAPEVEEQRLIIESRGEALELLDGRVQHNNGWFIVRSVFRPGATRNAVDWIIRPHAIPDWQYEPVIQVSQVGYHPDQKKVAVIEMDARDEGGGKVRLLRVREEGGVDVVKEAEPERWGTFLRYKYARFDFSDVSEPGMYRIAFRDTRSEPFRIAADVYELAVWQPTLEQFMPIQMCHMRVEEQYRVWHGRCHLDDARMAPTDTNHFDGYMQGSETLGPYASGETVPGLNRGGWHDAGDDDLRIESQADEVFVLAAAYELFGVEYDNTAIDQENLLVRIHQPDGMPDLLQQVEHGVLSILGPYRAMGRLYDGIIVPTLKQYVLIGDITNQTDNLYFDPDLEHEEQTGTHSAKPDDRWIFTEEHAGHEYKGIAALAIAARVLREFNPDLATECEAAAVDLWSRERADETAFAEKVAAAVELLLTTDETEYAAFLKDSDEQIVAEISRVGWALGRVLPTLADAGFEERIRAAVADDFARVAEAQLENPYGVPYRPYIWGAGWGIQRFGVGQYFLHHGFPEIVTPEYMLNALNFVLGVHPGSNVASFVSGVGARSMTTGYGLNRGDWSYIPGGVVSGTALIRPDFPELKEFPYLWQQAEYVVGGGGTHFMFLALAADAVLDG